MGNAGHPKISKSKAYTTDYQRIKKSLEKE